MSPLPTEPTTQAPGSQSPIARRFGPWAAGLLVLAFGVAFAAGSASSSTETPRPAVPVATQHLQPVTSYLTTHAFTGKLTAPRRSSLGFERGGRLESIRVSEGQFVEAGAELARINSSVLVAQLREARARVAVGRARLAELVAGPRPEELERVRERVRERRAQLDLARLTRARQDRLAREGVVSPEGHDRASTEVSASEARLAQAVSLLRLLERGTRREQVVAQRATLEGLEASLATRTVELRQTVLRAPFAGKVGLVHADPGTVVSAGSPVMTLIESKALEAWVGVPPGPARALTVGSQQVVLIEGRPVRALVRAQLPELDPATRTSTVILTLEDSAGLLPEQIVRLVLPRRLPATGYWVPLTALSHGERAVWSLLVVVSSKDEATVERRLIEVLHTDPGRALVRGDLRAGEAYVSTGVHRVVPGQRVAPRAAQ